MTALTDQPRVEPWEERVDTVACKIPDCPNMTEVVKGRYAKLCEVHRRELADTIRAGHRADAEDRLKGGEPNGNGRAHGREAALRDALDVARELDRAEAKARDAIEAVKEVRARYDEKVKALHRPSGTIA